MNFLRRFLLCLWSLALIAGAASIGVCAFNPVSAKYYTYWLDSVAGSGRFFWWLLLTSVVLLVLGMLGVFVALARKAAPPNQVVIGRSEDGQVNISLNAVDNVVRKAALSVTGVKEVKVHLKPLDNTLHISLQIALPHDISMPETAAAVQQVVKEQLQAITGLAVADVAVLVSSVEDKVNKTVQA